MYPASMPEDNPKLERIQTSAAAQRLRFRTPYCGEPQTFRCVFRAALSIMLILFSCQVQAANKLRLAAQKTGTFAFELAVIKAQGLDKKADLDIEVAELASPEAAKVALMGGSVDIILSDWLWVARQRNLGNPLLFFPYSTALGAVMVASASPISSLEDLKGRKLGVAGGALDKSWLLLQALAARSGLDLKSEAKIVYGAPALLQQKALAGEVDASLNYWNFSVALEARGFRRLIDMEEVLRRLGFKEKLAMVGYVFEQRFAEAHSDALRRFFKIAQEARESLARSDADWGMIGRQIGVEDPTELALYRRAYLDGVPHRPIEDEITEARALYGLLAKIGGSALVGAHGQFDPDLYFRGAIAPSQEN